MWGDEMYEEALTYLRAAVGDTSATFQDDQFEAINALATDRSRVFLVQRTGWGKSMVYFLTTRLLRDREEGPTLLISPLLALMRDQIQAAGRIGVRAEAINSTNQDDWADIEHRLHNNEIDVLLVSPEKLANESFLENCLMPIADRVGLIVIDEAHCISDWGHDFRPDYRRISRIISLLPPNIPVLATTATANNRVVADVAHQMGNNVVQVRGPLARSSLSLESLHLPNQAARLTWLLNNIPGLPGSGIIYCLTKRDVQQVANWLSSNGIAVMPYHGGSEDRPELERKLLDNEIKALVSTNALGMGFDKPDLGFVVHYQSPQSVVHYYQQVGRAGRAIENAYGILMSGDEDDEIIQFFIRSAFPRERDILAILGVLESFDDGCTIANIEAELNLRHGQIEKVLKLLAVEKQSPVLKTGSTWHRTANPFSMDRERIAHLTSQRQTEWEEMQSYANAQTCLMQFLGQALDDPHAEACGKCAVCRGAPIVSHDLPPETIREASRFLKHSEIEIAPRRRWAKDAFPQYGFSGNISDDLQLNPGRALCRWGDYGWGTLVEQGKEARSFADELVHGTVEMIRDRWNPDPYPEWVTCIPSLRDTVLVPDYAQRLADLLGIPFVPAVNKVRETEQQKYMLNGFHQAHNLDGAFAVEQESVLPGPVLLIDDIVDSKWSMTIIGALLLQNGSGPVYPVALSATSSS